MEKNNICGDTIFRSYDGSLDFLASYMRDSLTEEAWLFLNHISSIMAFGVLDEIYQKEKTAEVSLKYLQYHNNYVYNFESKTEISLQSESLFYQWKGINRKMFENRTIKVEKYDQ